MIITVNNNQYELENLTITGLHVGEIETTINIDKSDPIATIYTSDNTYLNLLKKIIPDNPSVQIVDILRTKKGDITGIKARLPKKFITIRRKLKTSADFTEEERAAIGRRLHKRTDDDALKLTPDVEL